MHKKTEEYLGGPRPDLGIRAAAGAFTDEAARHEQAVAQMLHRLKTAEISETDPAVYQHFEGGVQKLRAMRRILAEIERHIRDLVRAEREWEKWDARLREMHED